MPTVQKPTHGFVLQICRLVSIYDPSLEGILKYVKMVKIFIKNVYLNGFYKILTLQKVIIKQYCLCELKKKQNNRYLDIKFVKHNDITKFVNFITAESNILTNKYVRQIVK